MKDYTNYDASDFLNDRAFLSWMRQENEQNNAFWNKWLQEHPEKIEAVQSAKESYSLLMSVKRIHSEAKDYEDVWRHIDLSIRRHDRSGRILSRLRQHWWQYAAVLALLLAVAWMGYNINHPSGKYEIIVKADGVIKRVVLPDSTIVVLNKHAQISYSSADIRDVKLQGEAFFHVKKKWSPSGPKPFIVHSGVIKITVLGTSFSAKNSVNASRVILVSGKVKASAYSQTVVMQPGEKLEWSDHHFIKKRVNAQLYIAWEEGGFHFHHTSIKELAEVLKDTYGDTLVIKGNKPLPVQYISGRISSGNEQMLWNTLAILLNVKVERHGKRVILIPN